MTAELRMAQVRRYDKCPGDYYYWETIPFVDLRQGDRFRLVELDGALVDNGEEAIAESNPYMCNGESVKYESTGEPVPKGTNIIQCTVIKEP